MLVLLIIASLIAIFLFIALFMRKDHYVKRDILINAPRQKVFDFLRFLKNQEKFNVWAKTDPDRKEQYLGTDGTVGYIYSWSGNQSAGQAEKEIISINEGTRIETEIRFTKPMKTKASMIMETESLGDNQTKVSFTNAGALPYPLNIMIPVFEKNFAKGMDESLMKLKSIMET